MAIANAAVTAGNDFSSGDTVTDTTLDLAANPTVALSPTGDTDTGLSSPSANVLGVEAGGTEIGRFSTGGFQLAYSIIRDVNNSVLAIYGGTATNGANIELYGGAHATLADDAFFDADELTFRDQSGGTTHGKISGSGLTVGATGNAIKAIWYASESVSDLSISAKTSVTGTVTVTGAATGDIVIVTIIDTSSGYPRGNVRFRGYVSSADTVTYAMTNLHQSSAQAMVGTLGIVVLDIT